MDWMLGKGGGGVKKMHATARGSQDDAGGRHRHPNPRDWTKPEVPWVQDRSDTPGLKRWLEARGF